ncbi:MAG: bfr [Firmicutes bacterium]|nr:bfr [Bacillota bacterium]
MISRILFLEGKPIVSEVNKIHIGSDVAQMFKNDHEHEKNTIVAYNEAIKLACEVKDFATREILEQILSDEDGHIDAIEEVCGSSPPNPTIANARRCTQIQRFFFLPI